MAQSLWEEAADKVNTRWQDQLVALSDKSCNPSALLAKVLEKQKICRDKQWRVYKPNGHRVFVREILENVATWVSKVQAVGDVICSFDPVHASLPWAGARFLLTVSTKLQFHSYNTEYSRW